MRRTTRLRLFWIHGLLAMILSGPATGSGNPIDLALARQYFDEAKALSDRDGGRLWGRTLYGPMMFVDRPTRMIVADRADEAGKLTAQQGVFVGVLPPEHNIANTAFRYAGTRWTMVVWPPPEDEDARGLLLIHELWHRIQDDIGFPANSPANAHLDREDGRTWMRLEWAALRVALQSSGREREQASADALTFRAHRRSLHSSAAADERGLEMNEGLANYTGAAIAGKSTSEQIRLALDEMREGEGKPTYVRSFAYASGPAYGLLLDQLRPDWRESLKATDDLGASLAEAIGHAPPADLAGACTTLAPNYGGKAIMAEEKARDEGRQSKLAALRSKLVTGPTLQLPFSQMKIQLDPDGLIPLDDLGTVYPTARIVDAWGVLTVTDGALIDKSWSGVWVAAPTDLSARPLAGNGWMLELSAGWTAVANAGGRGFRVQRSP